MAFSAKNLQNRATYDDHQGMNQVMLVQHDPLEINGDVTGRKYVFKKMNEINWVDKSDLASIKHVKGVQIL